MRREFDDGVVIRHFAPDDLERVKTFFATLGGQTRAMFDRNDYNTNRALSCFTDQAPENNEPFLAEKDGVMIGYVYLWDVHKTVPWLGICVHDRCQGMHLGRRLLAFAEDYVKSLGCGGILLTTHMANARAQNLYCRMGYEYMGIATDGEQLFLRSFDRETADAKEE